MLCTSSEAAKILRRLNDEKMTIEARESMSLHFTAAVNEDIEDARPEYDYDETRMALDEIDAEIRKLKHAINTFNLTHEVPGFGMTVDMMLVYIPQLTRKKQRLSAMKDRLPKVREMTRVAGIIEYSYANYDIERATEDFEKVSDELSRAQTALDVLNNSVKFEINI
ncbi:MAG: hypothetical protein IKQ95_10485 [Synergistaceae bacterium]|nr:hypothetical protein [Synergistaceae bacterium]